MAKFIQDGTGIVVSVADEKDERFTNGWKRVGSDKPSKRTTKSKPSVATEAPSEPDGADQTSDE